MSRQAASLSVGQRVRIKSEDAWLHGRLGTVAVIRKSFSGCDLAALGDIRLWVDMDDALPAELLSFDPDDRWNRSHWILVWPQDCLPESAEAPSQISVTPPAKAPESESRRPADRVLQDLQQAQVHLDRAMGRLNQIAGSGAAWIGSWGEQRKLVALVLRLRDLTGRIERGGGRNRVRRIGKLPR